MVGKNKREIVMLVESWNPNVADQEFENVAVERLVKAANIMRAAIRRKCPIGTISRPMYQTGDYRGQPWTSRDNGRLRRSIRVTRKKTKTGKAFSKKRNVRVYGGSYPPGIRDEDDAFYIAIVEYYTPFMRPAVDESIPMIKTLIGVK